jgi:hypothetical protein
LSAPDQTEATLYSAMDDAKKAKRGKPMEAVAEMQSPTTDACI